jgi:hypothetical protein
MQLQIERGVMPANGPHRRLFSVCSSPLVAGDAVCPGNFYTGGSKFYYVEPKPEICSAQKAWLVDHLNQFENVLYAGL